MIFVFLCLTYLLNFCNNFLANLNSDSLILPPHCFESDTSKLQIQPCLTPFLSPSMALFCLGTRSRLLNIAFKACYNLPIYFPSLSRYGSSPHTLNSSYAEILPWQILFYFYLHDHTYSSLCLEFPPSLHLLVELLLIFQDPAQVTSSLKPS